MKIVTVSLGMIIDLSSPSVPSHAQGRPDLPTDCNKAITQMEMNLCAQNRAESADKKLNNTYQILQRRLAITLR